MWGPRPSNYIVFIHGESKVFATNKELRFEEVKRKDKPPLFALL